MAVTFTGSVHAHTEQIHNQPAEDEIMEAGAGQLLQDTWTMVPLPVATVTVL